MLVVYVLDDIGVSIFGVDLHDDCFDGRVALDKYPCWSILVPDASEPDRHEDCF